MSAEPLTGLIAAVLAEGCADPGAIEVVEANGGTVATVPPAQWTAALTAARDGLGAAFFDWLAAVDELEDGFTVAAHVCACDDSGPLRRGRGVILKTRVARDRPVLDSATPVYRGANWHEREASEMFGLDFAGHPGLAPLLLPDGFEGYPLRKEFILASRVAKAWPGAKEPGESDAATAASPGRRRMLPPGVPGEEWLKPRRPAADGAGNGEAGPGPGGGAA
jgi:NADH-quinone oxidoreductase subunit C